MEWRRFVQLDPSIPLQGRSPFLNVPDDMMDAIFTKLSPLGVKEKMNMGLVCQRFKQRIKKRSSWKGLGESELYICKDEENIWINGYPFTFEIAHVALKRLLKLIEVEQFISNDLNAIWELFIPALPAMTGCSKTHSININGHGCQVDQAMKFAKEYFSNFPNLTTLLFHCRISNFSEPYKFPLNLGNHCSNLTRFGLKLNSWRNSHQMFLPTIVNWFPKLTQLDIFSIGGFPTNAILELIGNIFAKNQNCSNKLFNFKLTVQARRRGDVMLELATVTWYDNELLEITAKNGQWSCKKNNANVVIELCLDGGQLYDSDSDDGSESTSNAGDSGSDTDASLSDL